MNQEIAHSNKFNQTYQTKYCLAETYLYKILSDLNCHDNAYSRILDWASYWSKEKVFFDESRNHKFHKRYIVLKHQKPLLLKSTKMIQKT